MATHLTEIGPDGRRVRQVEMTEQGTAIKTDAEDWPVNPPLVDLVDPQLPDQEIVSVRTRASRRLSATRMGRTSVQEPLLVRGVQRTDRYLVDRRSA